MITSSPGFTPRPRMAMYSASVPLAQETQCLMPKVSAQASFECFYLRTPNIRRLSDHLPDRRINLGLDAKILRVQINKRNFHKILKIGEIIKDGVEAAPDFLHRSLGERCLSSRQRRRQ